MKKNYYCGFGGFNSGGNEKWSSRIRAALVGEFLILQRNMLPEEFFMDHLTLEDVDHIFLQKIVTHFPSTVAYTRRCRFTIFLNS
jgi:hypothetical protein